MLLTTTIQGKTLNVVPNILRFIVLFFYFYLLYDLPKDPLSSTNSFDNNADRKYLREQKHGMYGTML
jgi:hypothetical protein